MNPTLPFGFEYPTPETDSVFGRALNGVWALDGTRVLVAPWLQSDESLVIEWDGTKGTWQPDDLVPADISFEDAITFYVQMCYERDFGCNMERMTMFKQMHDSANADLLWTCREQTQVRATPQSYAEGAAAWRAYAAGETAMAPPAPAASGAPVVVAFFSDYGFSAANPPNSATNPAAVAHLVKSWKPNAIVTGGDNNYPSGKSATIDENIGSLYRNFIFPFNGTAPLWPGETDATVNKFWPALGNHDWDTADAQPYFDYFAGVLPNAARVGSPGEPRFYEVLLGPMHFFVLNSGYDTALAIHEPLGIEPMGVQAADWLAVRAAASTAPFKIAVIHHPPFSSDAAYTPGYDKLRWSFKEWGLDLVLSGHGHNYERLEVGGQPYLIAGTGGTDLRGFATPVAGSLVRIADAWGAVRLTADCEVLVAEFIDTDGVTRDTLTLKA